MRTVSSFLCISILLSGSNAFSGVTIDGNNDRLNYKYWLPRKTYIAFNYDSQNRLTGYRVAFEADDGKLFNEWLLKKDNGEKILFPFILESTLIIDYGEIKKTGQWGFGRLDGNDSNLSGSYIDSSAYDWLPEKGGRTDKYGIGIINPEKLQGGKIYSYWMGLKESESWFPANPKGLSAILRFRLNIDLSSAKKFGYSEDEIERDFKLGKGWGGIPFKPYGYSQVDVDKYYSDQEIGDYFSFSIEKREGSDLVTYADYIVVSGMLGQVCKERGGETVYVNSLEECFEIEDNKSTIDHSDPNDSTDLFVGDYSDQGIPGTSTPPDPIETPASGKLPDFITSKVTMGNKDGNHEQYTWKINETAYVHDYIDNIGTADWEGNAKKIKVPFYLSKGTKEDSHSEWVRIGERQEIKKEHLKVNSDPKHEKIEFKLQDYANDGTIMPGRTYNFVVCADRPKDQDNGDGDVKEKHKSNNCSTEAVFYVDYGPPRNVDLIARNLALTGGRSSLQAGEKYGLQMEVSNIGTEQPWNGFSSSYEIKGPGTGGAWQKIGEDTSRASSLYPNATHFEAMDGDAEIAAPMVGGDYVFRACADFTQAVPETDESNNCTAELPVYIAPPPAPDLTAHSLQLNSGGTNLTGGSLYGLNVNVQNIGQLPASSSFQIRYEINGPETGGVSKLIAASTFNTVPLASGADQQHKTNDSFAQAPKTEGDYTLRACIDSAAAVAELDEENNCTETSVSVSQAPASSLSPVYRFWSDAYQSHFYTIDEDEKNNTDNHWRYEGIAYCAYASQENNSQPVYRFWSDAYQSHFYTIDEDEKNNTDNHWRYEGIAYYGYKNQETDTIPVYRFWSDTYQNHFYTVSEAEKDYVIATYPPEIWRYEGVAWYTFSCP